MTPDELKSAIDRTKAQIYHLKQQIEETPDPKEKRRLEHRLKELRILQLWHIGRLRRERYD